MGTIDSIKIDTKYIDKSSICMNPQAQRSNTEIFSNNTTTSNEDVFVPSVKENQKNTENTTKKIIKWTSIGLASLAVIGTGIYLASKFRKPPLFGEEIKKISEIDTFSKLKMTKGLSEAEKQKCLKILNFADNKDIFYPTLSGFKPSCILSTVGEDMHILDKLNLGKNIEFIHAKPFSPKEGLNFFNTHMLNKKEVMRTIKRNKEIYTTGLGLPKKASLKDIYQKVRELCAGDVGRFSAEHQEILGMTLGYPKYSSTIFGLEMLGNVNSDLRGLKLYKDKLIETLHSSPYKNLSKKELIQLEEKIKQILPFEKFQEIQEKGSFNFGFYQFIKFVEEPEECNRITKAIEKFYRTFRTSHF